MAARAMTKGVIQSLSEMWPLLFQIGVIGGVYLILRESVYRLVPLPEQGYFRFSITLGVVSRPVSLMVFVGAVALLLARRNLRWPDIDFGNHLRVFVMALTITLAWLLSTYAVNAFYGQAHLIDRLLLVGLAVLVAVRPAATGVFVVVAVAIVSQFEHPLDGFSWTDKRVVFNLLILFVATIVVGALTRRRLQALLFLSMAVVGAWYLVAGLGKLRLGWVQHEQPANLFVASYVNGWLHFLDESVVLRIAGMFEWARLPVTIAIVVLESSAILLFATRRMAVAVLFGLVLMHVLIFAASGLFFWMWVVVDLALVNFLLKVDDDFLATFFAPLLIPLGVAAMLFLAYSPSSWMYELAWLDSPLSVTYELRAVGRSGAEYPVARNFMAPYDTYFGQNRFEYLRQDKNLVDTYGEVGSWRTAREVGKVTSLAEIRALQARIGEDVRDPTEARQYDRFICRYFSWVNRQGRGTHALPVPLRAPPHVWSSAPPGQFRGQEQVVVVRVEQFTTLFDDRIRTLERKEVHRTQIANCG